MRVCIEKKKKEKEERKKNELYGVGSRRALAGRKGVEGGNGTRGLNVDAQRRRVSEVSGHGCAHRSSAANSPVRYFPFGNK